jgi:hypothetical protein
MHHIKNFFIKSYNTDKTCFYLEMISAAITITASLMLALTARHPDMTVIYPGFFVGSCISAYTNTRRGLAWPALLTIYFASVNILGWVRAMGYI